MYMLKIISERHEESRTEHRLQFDRKGERAGNGYSFPLLHKDSTIVPVMETDYGSNLYVPCTEEECSWWNSYLNVKNDREHYKEPYVITQTWHWIEPAHAICNCGEEILIQDDYMGACQCPNCGQWYNLFGQEILDPSEWEIYN